QSHAAALREMAVEERAVERDGVDEAAPGPGRRELGEARAAALPHREVAPAVPCLLAPRPRSGGMPAPEADRQDGGDAQPEGPPRRAIAPRAPGGTRGRAPARSACASAGRSRGGCR